MNIYHMTGQLRDDLKKLELENQSLRKAAEAARVALEAITLRVPIMGSTGDYRQGQLDALEACSEQATAALCVRN